MRDNETVNAINVNENCFDIIRLVCTLTVFFGHFLTHFSVDNTVLHGIAYFVRGVPVFFFLSGLFIARSLERYKTGEFLKRRAIRIFPELWVCVLVNILIITISLGGGYNLKDITIYLGTQMTAFQFYTGEWLRQYGVGVPNGALWTITVDIQFYIVAILIAKLMKGRKIKTWGVVILISMLIDLALEKSKGLYPEILYKLLQCNLVPFIWIFLIGMCMYYNRERILPFIVRFKWGFIIAYLVWQYVIPGSIVKTFGGIRYNIITTVLMLLMIIGIGFSFTKRFRQDYSYSFYLYHMVVINFVINNLLKGFASVGQFLITLICSFIAIGILAVLSHRYVAGSLTRRIENRLL